MRHVHFDRDAAAALIEPLTDIVIRAGAAILAVNRSAMKVDGKTDGLAGNRGRSGGRPASSPRASPEVAPDIASLSEERALQATLPYRESFFLIDPLDGTKEFVAGRNEFTVNLALVTQGTPLLGIVSAPALGLIWRGIVGRGAERLTLGEGKPLIEPVLQPAFAPPRGQPWTASRSAARMAMPGPKPSLRQGRARYGANSARRSNSAGSPKAASISIPGCRRPPNGTWPRAMRSLRPPAAGSRIQTVRRWFLAPGGRTSSFRNSSPGAIQTRRFEAP